MPKKKQLHSKTVCLFFLLDRSLWTQVNTKLSFNLNTYIIRERYQYYLVQIWLLYCQDLSILQSRYVILNSLFLLHTWFQAVRHISSVLGTKLSSAVEDTEWALRTTVQKALWKLTSKKNLRQFPHIPFFSPPWGRMVKKKMWWWRTVSGAITSVGMIIGLPNLHE